MMQRHSDDDFQPLESYLPADIRRMLENPCLCFETHPNVRRLLFTGTPLNANSAPFQPDESQGTSQDELPPPPKTAQKTLDEYSSLPTISVQSSDSSTNVQSQSSRLSDKKRPASKTMRRSNDRLPRLIDVLAKAPKSETRRISRDLMKFVTPSGPRVEGDGTEELTQYIISITFLDSKSVIVQMTLLVAGFIIGQSGENIRDIMSKTKTTIFSYTEMSQNKMVRVFYIEGKNASISAAIKIMEMAVERYKELSEGKYSGKRVEKKQMIAEIVFRYNPPPRRQVPHAAGVQVENGRCQRAASW